MLYLVTGGAGFIGSHVVDAIIAQGDSARILDNLSTSIGEPCGKAELVIADIRCKESVKQALSGVDYIIHLAAISNVADSIADSRITNEINVSGTLNLLAASVKSSVKAFVFASSAAVYGDSNIPNREDMPLNALSPYAVSKLAAECYCRVYNTVYGLNTICLRYFNVFGPRQRRLPSPAVIPAFIGSLLDQQPITIYGSGSQTRDFIYVSDVARANLLACTVPRIGGSIFNIASGEGRSLNDLILFLESKIGLGVKHYINSQTGDIQYSLADISKAKTILLFERKICFNDGIDKTIEWYNAN